MADQHGNMYDNDGILTPLQMLQNRQARFQSAQKLLAPAAGMFRQEEFWYFEGEALADLESGGFKLSRSSGYGRFVCLLPPGAAVPSPQIDGVPLASPYGNVQGGQGQDAVPMMWDFRLSSQSLKVTGLNQKVHLQVTPSYQPVLPWSSSQLEHSCTTTAAGYLKCTDQSLKIKLPPGAREVDVTFYMRLTCMHSQDCSNAPEDAGIPVFYEDNYLPNQQLPASGSAISWGSQEKCVLDDLYCPQDYGTGNPRYMCDSEDAYTKAIKCAADPMPTPVRAMVWHKYHLSWRGRRMMLYLDDKFLRTQRADHLGEVLIDAAKNEASIWGVTVSSKSPVIRVISTDHDYHTTRVGRYFNFNADDLRIRHGDPSFDARVQQCQFDDIGDPLEDFTEFNDRELTVRIFGDAPNHLGTAHGRQKTHEADHQFRKGDLLLMDPASKCPACKDNLGVRAWNLPCGQRSHAIHVKDTQHVSGKVDMHFWFDMVPDLFDTNGQSEIVRTVRQCRYDALSGGPSSGPFHNARVEVRIWTAVPHGRREHGSAEHQFLVDDFLLSDPGVMCPKCKWILNSLRVLHLRHDGYGLNQQGIIFSFDSGIHIPHTGTVRVRQCRYKDTASAKHNSERTVQIWNNHAAPGQRGPGHRHGRNYWGAGGGDWEVGDILLLDHHVLCPETEMQLNWDAPCPTSLT